MTPTYSLLRALLLCILIVIKNVSFSQSCDNWLSTPVVGAKVTVGDLDISGNQLTIEARFNRTNPLNNGQFYGSLVSKHTTQTNVNYSLLPNGCEITTSGSGYKAIFQSCPIELNRNYHVAMVYDGSTLKFYRDGYLLSEVACTGDMVTNDLTTTIGQIADPSNPNYAQFLGYLDEVRIWNVARSQAQLQANMTGELSSPATQTGLQAYYNFSSVANLQGNAAFNGVLSGGGQIGQENTNCVFTPEFCNITNQDILADFEIPLSACVNAPIEIENTSVNASSYFWSFCQADISVSPGGVNLGNPGGALSAPVFSDIVSDNGNYYVFVTNNWPGGLVRLDFGNSMLNNPVAVPLGNVGGTIMNTAEGIQVVKNEGRWYAIIVGGDQDHGIPSAIVKIDFGSNITNPNPVGTNWGNVGNLRYPTDLHLFNDGGIWYGFTVNAQNNTITRFNFSSSFNNVPIGVNLGNPGGFDFPTGINAVKDNGNWHVFVVNDNNNPSLVRLDFGASLLSTPTAVNLGNPGGLLRKNRDIYILKDCGSITALAVNGLGFSNIVKLDFHNNITSIPTATSLGNVGSLNFPHSISQLFRVGNDLYSIITNVSDHTITRLKFDGCTSSSVQSSTSATPSPVMYATPGVYNISLTIDDGLPTQSTICKQILIEECNSADDSLVINSYTEVIALDNCKNVLEVMNAAEFKVGDTVLLIQMQGANVNLANNSTFGSVSGLGNAGNYEFNYIKSINGNQLELLYTVEKAYDLPGGKVQLVRVPYYESFTTPATLTCLPWDGSKGGVLAFNVGGTLTLDHNIDVSGRGFFGGLGNNTQQTSLNCASPDFAYPANSLLGAEKGQSIAILSTAQRNGRGAAAGGGGGGNDHNSGGGGGGNGGAGGFGGYQYEPCSAILFDNRGIGAYELNYNPAVAKIFLGGGGGAGHSNNPENASHPSNGGNGGALVLISAQTLNSNQHSIISKGGKAPEYVPSPSSNAHEAMGGGGAGGTILLQIDNYTQPTSVLVAGGAGANMTADALLYGRIGPGGGGGGGVVWHSGAALNPQVTVDASGGANGVLLQDTNNPWGATVGEPGIVLPGLVLPVTSTPFKPNIDSVRVRQILASCSKVDFEGLGYTNTSAISTWHWSFGDGNNSSLQNPSHEYGTEGVFQVKLVVTDINGCKDSITSQVTIGRPDYDFSYETDVCDPLVVTFTGLGITSSPYWSFGDGQTSTASAALVHTYGANGTYLVRYSVNTGNCTDTIEKSITVGATWENIVLTNDTTICAGATKQLLTKSSLDFCWFPTTYLDDPLSATPFTSTPVPMTYYFTAKTVGNNLIINGDFAQGNTSFTSDYIATTFNNTEGQYNIGTNAAAWNGGMSSCSDHTPGNNGNMMHVNGSPVANAKVWTQTVTVQPNTSYAFSTWIASLSASNPARLQFSINGNNLGGPILATVPTCSWNQFYTTWNSGNSTSAVISIVNTNTIQAGNDFALDDISFAPVFTRIDSVRINVETVSVKANNDTTICALQPVQMMASGAASYSWSPAAGLNDVTIANPVASPAVSTQYILTGTSANGCVDKDTVNVNIFQKPAMSLTDDTEICPASSITLEATGGTSYQWTPAATLSSAVIGNPVATPQQNTEYFVTITDANECRYHDSVTISIRPPAQFAINPPIGICANDKVLLTASGGNIYQWTAAPGITQLNVASPEVSPPVTTEYIVNITENVCNTSAELRTLVTVRPLPDIIASRSVDLDCSTDRSQLTARGGQTYLWNADPSLSNPAISNPVATPRVTTQYVVRGTDAAGCSNTDTVTVKVDRVNDGNYLMPTGFTPNNDGLNDCYGINLWGVVENVEFSIFNRWGERVFYSRDPRACWDGTYKGKPQDSAVFVYMVKASTMCEPSVFRKGTFVLIR